MKLNTLEDDFKVIMQDILDKVSAATGLKWIATSCRRTIREQNALYAQGRTLPGNKVTNAQGGSSPHNFGLGCDCAPMKKDASDIWWNAPANVWEEYGKICEEAHMTWGGMFKTIVDKPHCEHPRWKQQQALWRDKKIEVA